jgi:hypothetical protein
VHDLGLAAAFGGSLFGQVALDPAAKVIKSENERSLVLNQAWSRFNVVDALSLGAAAVTWFFGRGLASGKEVNRKARPLVIAKDVLMGTAVATGAANIIGGVIYAQDVAKTSGDSVSTPSHLTPEAKRKMHTMWNVLGAINLASLAGAIGLTAVLATKAGKSVRWSVFSRFLP